MKGYKANLCLVAGRYSDVERRALEYFALNPTETDIRMPGMGWEILLMYLIKDGFIVHAIPLNGLPQSIKGVPVAENYRLTDEGRDFVTKWVEASPLSSDIDTDFGD